MSALQRPSSSSNVDRLGRIKFIVLAIACAGLITWVLINLVPMLMPAGKLRGPDTPGWRLVDDLNTRLAEEPRFGGAAFVVESEEPLRFKVVGAVADGVDLAALKTRLKELRPEGDYDLEIELFDDIR